jgi:hypothetical protein
VADSHKEIIMAEMTRANRIAVSVVADGYKADFYRTHKKIATILSAESGWEADESMNKSAQREDFRKFAIDHASDVGVEWNPTDLRTEENKRIPKYETDDMLKEDAKNMLYGDIMELVAKCPHGVSYINMEAEWITPVRHTAKGTDLSKLGVIDGKYERSGNWAWADVEMMVTLTKDAEFIYYTTKVQLVSGQLKKPHITQTSFNEDIKKSLQEAGIWKEETKEAKADKVEVKEEVVEVREEPKAEESKVEDTVHAETDTKEEPKTTKKSRSRKSKKAEESAE